MMPKNSVYPWSNAQKLDWNKDWQAKSVCPFPDQKLFSHRNNLMAKQTRILFGEVPLDLDEFIFASQSTQAEAKKYFVEFWRSRKFEKTGIIWWNLRDGWPVISDAIVDYYNSKKKAYNYIKRSQTNVCVMMNDNLEVVAVNDTLREFEVSAKVSDIDTGEVLFDSTPMKIPANGKKIIGKLPSQEGKKFLAIEYFVDGKRAFNHYLLGTPPFKLDDYRRWIEKFESAAEK